MTAATRAASPLWVVLLTAASTALTLILACAAPFAALATVAALAMGRRDGIALMILSWAASQIIGFGLHDYPMDPATLAWGVGLGSSAVGSLLGARWAAARLTGAPALVRAAGAFGAAFIAGKAVLAVWALGLGGIWITLSPTYAADQFVREALTLAGLIALHHLLVRLGAPAIPAPAPRG